MRVMEEHNVKRVVHCIVRMKHAQCNALRRIIVHTFRGYAVTAWREKGGCTYMYLEVIQEHMIDLSQASNDDSGYR
jgi:DNA-directed RNA polymerase alpha subunit